MTWFKVDDRFHSHRKTRRLLRSHPGKARDAAAAGLWVLAGDWSADTRTDGFVPEDVLERFDDDWQELAKRLVDADYWEPGDHAGEQGYWFHDWDTYQPSSQLSAKRAAAGRAGGLRSGEVRREAKAKQTRSKTDFASKQNPENRQANATPKPAPDLQVSAFTRSNHEALASSKTKLPEPVPVSMADESSRLNAAELAEIGQATGGDEKHAARTAAFILDRAPGDIRKPAAYILAAIKADPDAYRYRRRNPRPDEFCNEHPGEWADSCRACSLEATMRGEP